MTLYLKYRPQKISELDLTSARETLTSLLKKGEIPHAFLFAGPRGTGKTSSARILAKAINCEKNKDKLAEPCNECETCRSITRGSHIDVIEMDAASNRGIDEVRALKQDIMLAPSLARKKIYIIDEVHMLTNEAANALLKTLEEPPAHVVFILATTDAHKLPQTVVSRLTVVPFHKASNDEIISKLNKISESEKFKVEEGVFRKIAERADGSFRDAVKILEELALTGNDISLKELEGTFYTGTENAHVLLTKLHDEGLESAITYLSELSKNGVDGKAFLNAFMNEVHMDLLKSVGIVYVSKNVLTQEEDVRILELLLEAKARVAHSTNDFLPLELALIKYGGKWEKAPEKKEQILPKETKPVMQPSIQEKEKEEVKVVEPVVEEKVNEPVIPTITMKAGSSMDDQEWGKVLMEIKQKNAGVEALLRAAKPVGFDGRELTLGIYFQFHKERLEVPSIRSVLEECLNKSMGQQIKVSYLLCDPPKRVQNVSYTNEAPSLTQPASPDIINAAKEIFG